MEKYQGPKVNPKTQLKTIHSFTTITGVRKRFTWEVYVGCGSPYQCKFHFEYSSKEISSSGRQ